MKNTTALWSECSQTSSELLSHHWRSLLPWLGLSSPLLKQAAQPQAQVREVLCPPRAQRNFSGQMSRDWNISSPPFTQKIPAFTAEAASTRHQLCPVPPRPYRRFAHNPPLLVVPGQRRPNLVPNFVPLLLALPREDKLLFLHRGRAPQLHG